MDGSTRTFAAAAASIGDRPAVATLVVQITKQLLRLVLNGDRVAAEEHLLLSPEQRVRDARQGPDGALYLLTDDDNGQLLRVVPKH
jgi:glucose/arabinose dehydrogenase